MQNLVTIYRFYTPFLDVKAEKNNLTWVLNKIENSLIFDWLKFKRETEETKNYIKISFILDNDNWIFNFYYIKNLKEKKYYLPIFKLDIFLNNKFLISNKYRKKTVQFLNNIFECFDWLDEKEYLYDINSNVFYTKWFFNTKRFPQNDFLNLEKIKEKFEKEDWIKKLEEFIYFIQKKDFILTEKNSKKYFEIYGLLIYFIYLIYILDLNITQTDSVLKELWNLDKEILDDGNIKLMKIRLKNIDDLTLVTYKKYRKLLDLFFNLFE